MGNVMVLGGEKRPWLFEPIYSLICYMQQLRPSRLYTLDKGGSCPMLRHTSTHKAWRNGVLSKPSSIVCP